MPEARAQLDDARVAAQRHGLGLDAAALAAIDRGDAVARLLPTTDGRDVAIIGVVRIAATRQSYLASVDDFAAWLRTPTRTRLGVFDAAPGLATMRELRVPDDEARDLRKCRPGDCTTKLPSAAMEHARARIDWSAADNVRHVTAWTRARLLDLLQDYVGRGNAALPVYDDKAQVRSADVSQALLARSVYLTQTGAVLGTYLQRYPAGRPTGARDVLHWSEDSGTRFRPVLSVAHSVVWTPPTHEGTAVIATKQLYANHYFEGALEVVSVTERGGAGGGPASYLVLERRVRFDAIPRIGVFNLRARTVDGLRDRLLADLRREQRTWATSANR